MAILHWPGHAMPQCCVWDHDQPQLNISIYWLPPPLDLPPPLARKFCPQEMVSLAWPRTLLEPLLEEEKISGKDSSSSSSRCCFVAHRIIIIIFMIFNERDRVREGQRITWAGVWEVAYYHTLAGKIKLQNSEAVVIGQKNLLIRRRHQQATNPTFLHGLKLAPIMGDQLLNSFPSEGGKEKIGWNFKLGQKKMAEKVQFKKQQRNANSAFLANFTHH